MGFIFHGETNSIMDNKFWRKVSQTNGQVVDKHKRQLEELLELCESRSSGVKSVRFIHKNLLLEDRAIIVPCSPIPWNIFEDNLETTTMNHQSKFLRAILNLLPNAHIIYIIADHVIPENIASFLPRWQAHMTSLEINTSLLSQVCPDITNLENTKFDSIISEPTDQYMDIVTRMTPILVAKRNVSYEEAKIMAFRRIAEIELFQNLFADNVIVTYKSIYAQLYRSGTLINPLSM